MAKHISEVEDGFALRRGVKKKKKKFKDECTIPPALPTTTFSVTAFNVAQAFGWASI
jgi:hypothetical protein